MEDPPYAPVATHISHLFVPWEKVFRQILRVNQKPCIVGNVVRIEHSPHIRMFDHPEKRLVLDLSYLIEYGRNELFIVFKGIEKGLCAHGHPNIRVYLAQKEDGLHPFRKIFIERIPLR